MDRNMTRFTAIAIAAAVAAVAGAAVYWALWLAHVSYQPDEGLVLGACLTALGCAVLGGGGAALPGPWRIWVGIGAVLVLFILMDVLYHWLGRPSSAFRP